MRVLFIYDCVFGDPEKSAQVISVCLGARASVEKSRAEKILPGQLKEVELLVVGSPARGFRPAVSHASEVSRSSRLDSRNGIEGRTVSPFYQLKPEAE